MFTIDASRLPREGAQNMYDGIAKDTFGSLW
jgi:hypothetical protein